MSQGENMFPFGTTDKLRLWPYLVVQKHIRFFMAEAEFVVLHEPADINSIFAHEKK